MHNQWEADLRCPCCRGRLTAEYECQQCGEAFPVLQGQPVLVNFNASILDRESFLTRDGQSPISRRVGMRQVLTRFLAGPNKSAQRFSDEILRRLPAGGRVLVIGGGSIGSGSQHLYDSKFVVGTDIYPSAHTHLVADAHDLPFCDSSFDAVWIQAVLEHVLSPHRVVEEIHRILTPNGLVFADTPFMQQVHEGAYDFTRFTLSGHRWLFRHFEEIGTGVTGGAGTSLMWAIRYFVRAATGSEKLGWIASIAFFWLRFFDGASRRHEDAATGVYFFGTKASETFSARSLPDFYHSRAI